MKRLTERERIVCRMQEVSRDIAMVDKLLAIEVKGSDYGHLIKRCFFQAEDGIRDA